MCKRRFLKATEVEAIFNESRNEEFLASEDAIIRTIVETAKRNGRIGDKTLLVVPPQYVHIPDWQRTADLARAREIGSNYNRYKWEVPKVVYTEGKLYCIDGMHRLLGALMGDIPDVVIEIMEISEEEAIDLFLGQTIDRNKMKPMDYYNASIKAKKPDYISFREICHKYNVQVKGDDELPNPVGTFTSISDGVRIDKDLLDRILNLINKLRWNGRDVGGSSAAYGTKVIRSIKKLYAYYAGNEKQMEKILTTYCKGTEWFNENLADMPQYYIFDLLSKTVNDAMIRSKVVNMKATTA